MLYPVFLRLQDRNVLVIGAGDIAWQKLQGLKECEARLHVVAPEALPEIQALARSGAWRWSARGYESSDLDGVDLVIAATDDEILQKRVAAEARARKIWLNVVDVPPLCDFYAGAVVNQGDVQIAISTGGFAPALAKLLRQKLETSLGPEYAELTRLAKQFRPRIMTLPKEQRRDLWARIVNDDFLERLRREGAAQAESQIKQWMETPH